MRVREILLLLVIITGCTTKRNGLGLVENAVRFDSLLKQKELDPVRVFQRLEEIEEYLLKSDQRNTKNEDWQTNVNFKWNTDSTIVFIRSFKKFKKGFKREIALNFNDTTLFVYRFSTEPMGDASTMKMKEQYSFIEEYTYLKDSQPISFFNRVMWDQEALTDTIKFRKTLFSNRTNSIQKDLYQFEMDYVQNILSYN